MSEHANNVTPEGMGTDLREEMRVGVRMMKALEVQLQRAERVLQEEVEASRRADDAVARLRRETVTRTTEAPDDTTPTSNAAVQNEQFMRRLEGLAKDVGGRLDAQAVRIAELDATMSTLERRIDHLLSGPPATPTSTSSGSLSVSPDPTNSSIVPPSEPLGEDLSKLRHEIRRELEGVRRASGSLADAIEAAERTETVLRSTLAVATDIEASKSGEGATSWSITSVLRRLADEFEAAANGSASEPATRPATTTRIPMDRPVVLDLTANPAATPSSPAGRD